MLVLTRKEGEAIHIGDFIEVVVLSAKRGRIKLGFRCPPEISIRRKELDGGAARHQFDTRDSQTPLRILLVEDSVVSARIAIMHSMPPILRIT